MAVTVRRHTGDKMELYEGERPFRKVVFPATKHGMQLASVDKRHKIL